MKAIQCVEWGEPSKLVLAELPLPEPGSRAGAHSHRRGRRQFSRRADRAEEVSDCSRSCRSCRAPKSPGRSTRSVSDVQHLKVGDRVIAFVGVGGFAEYVCAPAALAVAIPDGVSDEVAAAFTLTYATSHHALFDRGQLKAGETLLVLGAGGGVGLAAVELGKVAGARVIAAASSADKLAAAKEHGADELIDYSATDLREAVKTLTGGNGADVIYDPVGGPGTEAAVRSLAWRGRLLIVGFAQGEIPQIPANLLLLKGASAVGVFWGEFARREPKANFAMLKELFAWLKEGRLKPHVSQVYPLAETAARAWRRCSPATSSASSWFGLNGENSDETACRVSSLLQSLGVARRRRAQHRQVDRRAGNARPDMGRVDDARRHHQLLCAGREDRAEGRRRVPDLHQPAGRAGYERRR